MRLKDQVVLVTGASRGVGAACAVACAKEGAHVALAAKSVESHPKLPGTLGEVAREVEALGRKALVIPCDVRDEGQVQAMVDQTVARFGRLDALINNAGAIFVAPVASFPAKRFDLVMGINARAAFLASQVAIPHMREGGGHILMMSPPVATGGAVGKAPYLLSKICMTVLAQAIDVEEKNVHACALWPVTGVNTAAVTMFGSVPLAQLRKVEILSEATVELLARDPAECSFRAWLDEEVQAELRGITDFTPYRCEPDSEPDGHSILLIDPTWTR